MIEAIMRRPLWLLVLLSLAAAGCAPMAPEEQGGFARLLSAPHRGERNVVRDPHRHPAETLAFFHRHLR